MIVRSAGSGEEYTVKPLGDLLATDGDTYAQYAVLESPPGKRCDVPEVLWFNRDELESLYHSIGKELNL